MRKGAKEWLGETSLIGEEDEEANCVEMLDCSYATGLDGKMESLRHETTIHPDSKDASRCSICC